MVGEFLGEIDRGVLTELNRSSQQRVRERNLGIALGFAAAARWLARLSSRRLARRAGRSGDSRARALPASPSGIARGVRLPPF